MKIFLTGGSGFIGSHLLAALTEQQVHDIVNFDRNADASYDLRDIDAVRRAMPQEPHCVVHLAGEVSVTSSINDLHRFQEANTGGTANVVQVAVERKAQRFVYASSMSIYGDGCRGVAICEDWPKRPTNPYGLTKWMGEQIVTHYCHLHGMKTCSLRLWNTYGPGQSLENRETGAVANIAAAILRGERPQLYMMGESMRDWIHVRDVVQAFMLAIDGQLSGPVNVGTGRPWSVSDVAWALHRFLGGDSRSTPIQLSVKRFGDAEHCFPDITKLSSAHGYGPAVSTIRGLQEYCTYLLEMQDKC